MNRKHQNELIIGEGLGVGELAYKEVMRPAGGAAGAGAAGIARFAVHSSEGTEGVGSGAAGMADFAQSMFAALPVAVIFGLLSVWDHRHEMRVLRSEFESEIGAQLGKAPETVTVKDMMQVAKSNPVIADAIQRSRKQRNLSIAITTIGTFASVALALFCAPLIPAALTTGIAGFLVHGSIGFLAFMAAEKGLDYVGTRALHLKEPPIRAVELSPELQPQLSVSNQIRMLARAQARRKPISETQVLTVFLSANPDLQQQIVAQYGAPFARLSDATKMQVTRDMDSVLGISELTQDINSHQIRAQELAFAVTGRPSGVPRMETPQKAKLDIAQEKLAAAEQKIAALTHEAERKTHNVVEKVEEKASHLLHRRSGDKMAFNHAAVSGVVPENQNIAKVASEGRSPNTATPASWTDRSQQSAPAAAGLAANLS